MARAASPAGGFGGRRRPSPPPLLLATAVGALRQVAASGVNVKTSTGSWATASLDSLVVAANMQQTYLLLVGSSSKGAASVCDSAAAMLLRTLKDTSGRRAARAVRPSELVLSAERGRAFVHAWGGSKEQPAYRMQVPEKLGCVACTAGAHLAAGGASGKLYLWQLASGRLLLAWDALQGVHGGGGVRADQLLVSAGADAIVLVWSFASLLQAAEGRRTPPPPLRTWTGTRCRCARSRSASAASTPSSPPPPTTTPSASGGSPPPSPPPSPPSAPSPPPPSPSTLSTRRSTPAERAERCGTCRCSRRPGRRRGGGPGAAAVAAAARHAGGWRRWWRAPTVCVSFRAGAGGVDGVRRRSCSSRASTRRCRATRWRSPPRARHRRRRPAPDDAKAPPAAQEIRGAAADDGPLATERAMGCVPVVLRAVGAGGGGVASAVVALDPECAELPLLAGSDTLGGGGAAAPLLPPAIAAEVAAADGGASGGGGGSAAAAGAGGAVGEDQHGLFALAAGAALAGPNKLYNHALSPLASSSATASGPPRPGTRARTTSTGQMAGSRAAAGRAPRRRARHVVRGEDDSGGGAEAERRRRRSASGAIAARSTSVRWRDARFTPTSSLPRFALARTAAASAATPRSPILL